MIPSLLMAARIHSHSLPQTGGTTSLIGLCSLNGLLLLNQSETYHHPPYILTVSASSPLNVLVSSTFGCLSTLPSSYSFRPSAPKLDLPETSPTLCHRSHNSPLANSVLALFFTVLAVLCNRFIDNPSRFCLNITAAFTSFTLPLRQLAPNPSLSLYLIVAAFRSSRTFQSLRR